MPLATMLAYAVHQPLDLALGEVTSLNCQVFDGWCAFLGSRFHADKPCLRATYCLAYASGNFGFTSALTTAGWGTNSCSNPNRFASRSLEKKLTPVTLPPGRARLATRPSLTGSVPLPKTMGIVVVAAFAASAAGVLQTMTAT